VIKRITAETQRHRGRRGRREEEIEALERDYMD
jgi:hypothetical protein